MQLEMRSQPVNKIDTSLMWVKRVDVLYHFSRSDSLTQYKKLVREKQKDLDSMTKAIKLQQETIVEYKGKDSLYKRVDSLNNHVVSLLESDIKILNREIKRLKRSRVGDRIVEGAIILILGYLTLTK